MEHGKPAESFGERCDKKRANPFPEFPNRDKQGLVDSIARMEILQDLRRRGDDRLVEKTLIRSVAGGRQRGIEDMGAGWITASSMKDIIVSGWHTQQSLFN